MFTYNMQTNAGSIVGVCRISWSSFLGWATRCT